MMTEEELHKCENQMRNDLQFITREEVLQLIAEVRRLQGQLRVSNMGILQLNTDNKRLLRVARAYHKYYHDPDTATDHKASCLPTCVCVLEEIAIAEEAAKDLIGEG